MLFVMFKNNTNTGLHWSHSLEKKLKGFNFLKDESCFSIQQDFRV